jgi:hypothetical protein
MKKLILLSILLIVGCNKNSTEPEVVEDCNGELGGTAVLDECGVCDDGAAVNGLCHDGTPAQFLFTQSMFQAYYYSNTVTIDGNNVETDDWIGAFKGDVCVGTRQWDTSECGGGICDVPVMGWCDYINDSDCDYPPAPFDEYLLPGDIPTFKIYDASENVYYDAVASEDIPPWSNFGFNNIESLNAITNP